MKIEWHEVDVHHIWRYWVRDYDPEHGKIVNHEAYYDPVKGRVVFKLYLEEDKTKQEQDENKTKS